MENDHILKALLKFALDKQTLAEVQRGEKQVEDGLKRIQKQAEETTKKMNQLREFSERIGSASMAITTIGAIITGPILVAAKTYVEKASEAEEVASRWRAQTEKISEAQMRVGRIATESLLPALEKAADLAASAADFVENHPGIIQKATTIGTAITALGAVGIAVSKGIRLYADVTTIAANAKAASTSMTAAALMNRAADKQLAAATTQAGSTLGSAGATTTASAAGSGAMARIPFAVIAAAGAALQIAYTRFAEKQLLKIPFVANVRQTQGQALSLAASGVGKLIGGEETATRWFSDVARALGVMKEEAVQLTPLLDQASSAMGNLTQSQMKTYLSYVTQDREAQKSYLEQRAQLVRDYNHQEAQANKEYRATQVQAVKSFWESERQNLASYSRERLQRARDHSIEMARIEEDFQNEQRRRAEDHDQSMMELAAERDALGMVREMRRFEKDRRDAEREHEKDVQRSNSDFARQQADTAQEFAAQRALRMAQFQQSQKDSEEQFKSQRQQARASHLQQLADLDQQANDERRRRRENLISQLGDLVDGLNAERNLRKQFTQAMLNDLKGAIQQAENGGAYPGRASGGYVGHGLYQLHDREYVLNQKTTRAAERLAGGRLSQDRLLSLLANGIGSRVVQVGDVTVSGGNLSEMKRQWDRFFDERIAKAFSE